MMISACGKRYVVIGLVGYLLASVPTGVSAQTELVSFEGATNNTGWSLAWQHFTMSSASQQGLYSVSLELNNGSPDGDEVYLELYAGARGSNACLPEFEGLIATSAAVEITNTEFGWVEFLFADLPELVPNWTYYVAVRDDAPDGGDQGITFEPGSFGGSGVFGAGGGAGNNCGKLNHRVRIAQKDTPDHTLSNIQFSPEGPARLRFGQRVNFSFDYSTNEAGGVLIYAEPRTQGSWSPSATTRGSPLHPVGNGSASDYYFFLVGPASVDEVEFRIYKSDNRALLREILVPVEYQWVDNPLRDARNRAVDTLANVPQSESGEGKTDSGLERDDRDLNADYPTKPGRPAVAVPVFSVPGLLGLILVMLGLAYRRVRAH